LAISEFIPGEDLKRDRGRYGVIGTKGSMGLDNMTFLNERRDLEPHLLGLMRKHFSKYGGHSFHSQTLVHSPDPHDDTKGAMDIVLCRGGSKYLSKIELVIELKLATNLKSEFDLEAASGQLVQYVQAVLELQPTRRSMYGIVSSEKKTHFYQVVRSDTGRPTVRVSEETKPINMFKLLNYLLSNPNLLGPDAPPDELLYRRYLGEGRTSRVYSFEDNTGNEYVHKKLKTGDDSVLDFNFDSEIRMLQRLQESQIENVPRLIQTPASNSQNLYISPVGNHLELKDWTVDIATDLLDLLQKIHSLGIVHRDIRPANIILRAGSVLLVDWGFAAMIDDDGRRITRAGAPYPFCPKDQKEAVDHVVQPSIDLYAWLMCLVEVGAAKIPKLNSERRVEFMKEIDWNAEELKCLAGDYEGLKTFAERVFEYLPL
jgi:predicted Ser/Thr protein kinase